jgi:catechol 2,3-dioxygenase-like lactoylglutathione lyase family enzyme
MQKHQEMIHLSFLDHVAIRVADVERSAAWYESVFGMKRFSPEAWKPFSVFMFAGKCGIAIFPANPEHHKDSAQQKGVKIDHFAFNVDRENFDLARQRYEAMGIEYDFQDHTFFHSIYTLDPDGHKVELTTVVEDELTFYNF